MIGVYMHDLADVKLSPEQGELIEKFAFGSRHIPSHKEAAMHKALLEDIDRVARWKYENA